MVTLEHRELERMGAGADATLESMDGGWGYLLELFKAEVERG